MEKKLILIQLEKVKLLENTVKFCSGKEIITLNHEAFDRALYSDGALSASEWLMKKNQAYIL